MPLMKEHCYCCHSEWVQRVVAPEHCPVCKSEVWWDKHRKPYKPRAGSIELFCEVCNISYFIRPQLLRVKQQRDNKEEERKKLRAERFNQE